MSIPIRLHHRATGLGVLNEGPLVGQLCIGGVVIEQTGLQVGHQLHPRRMEFRVDGQGVWKLVVVPSENVALLAATGITRAVMKRRNRHPSLLAFIDEPIELLLGIGCVGQTHGRLRKPQCPTRGQMGAPNQPNELGDHICRSAPRHHITIHVAIVDIDAAKKTVVVVVFATQVKSTSRQGVVIDPQPLAIQCARQDKRPMFVQRVARLGVVSDGVLTQTTQTATVQIQGPRLVAQAKVVLARLAHHAVPDQAGALLAEVGAGVTILHQHMSTGGV